MDIILGQTVYVQDDIAQAVGIDTYANGNTEVIVRWGNGTHQSFNANECIPMTPAQSRAYIVLAEMVYLFLSRAVTETESGIRVAVRFGDEDHEYTIAQDGTLSAIGTPSADMAQAHQRALAYLA